MSGGQAFTFAGSPVATDAPAPNIVAFCAYMAAAVAHRRGGKPSDYLTECSDFMTEAVGCWLSVSDTLPADHDWTPATAIELAEQMMEYDA